jgi:outer membrane protein TolC
MRKVTFIFTIFLFFTLFAFGQGDEDASAQRVKELSIDQISEMALTNSLDIQMIKFDVYIKRHDLDIATSLFDTFFSIYGNYTKDTMDVPSTFLGTRNITQTYGANITKKLPFGTELGLDVFQQRNNTNSAFSTLNPHHEANAKVSLKQPIGKNFFGLKDRADIKITKIDIESFEFTSLDDIENHLASIQKAYWRLVIAQYVFDIRKDMLDQAKRLNAVYERNFEIGLVEEPDLLATQANVQTRESELLINELNLIKAQNDLLLLLGEEDFDISIVPKDKIETSLVWRNLNEALSDAVDKRRDYKRAKKLIDKNRIEIVVKKNALWPQIDLEASFTRNGIQTGYNDAWREVYDDNQHEFYAGITITTSLERGAEKAELAQKKLEKQKYLLLLKKVEQTIFRQVNTRVTEVNMLANEVNTAKKVVLLQEQKLLAEEKRFKYGRSSTDLIIRYQEDLLDARLKLARSLFDYRTSLIDLDLAKNALLDRYWEGEL